MLRSVTRYMEYEETSKPFYDAEECLPVGYLAQPR